MKFILIGGGAMGSAAAQYLINMNNSAHLTIIDNNPENLHRLNNRFRNINNKPKLTLILMDVANEDMLQKMIKNCDLVLTALPWEYTLKSINAALLFRKPLISMTRPHYQDMTALQEKIVTYKSSVMLGCGLEPGLTEIFSRYLSEKFDTLNTLHIRCGGVPITPLPPLYYKSTFTQNRLPIDPKAAYYIKNGCLKQTSRFSGIERVNIEGVGVLEAWHDGMLPWLIELPHMRKAKYCTQKTLRWPGFAKKILLLKSLGLLNNQPIEIDGISISPRKFVDTVLRPSTSFLESDRDIVILQLLASGTQKEKNTRISLSLIQNFDETHSLSAMAKITGYMLALSACALSDSSYLPIGLIKPEIFFTSKKIKWLCEKLRNAGTTISINNQEIHS